MASRLPICRIFAAPWLFVLVIGLLPFGFVAGQTAEPRFQVSFTSTWVNPIGGDNLVSEITNGDTSAFTHGDPRQNLGNGQFITLGESNRVTVTHFAVPSSFSPGTGSVIGVLTMRNGTVRNGSAATNVTLRVRLAVGGIAQPLTADIPLSLIDTADNDDPIASADIVTMNPPAVVFQGPNGLKYNFEFTWDNNDQRSAQVNNRQVRVYEGGTASLNLVVNLRQLTPTVSAPADLYSAADVAGTQLLRCFYAWATGPGISYQWYQGQTGDTRAPLDAAKSPINACFLPPNGTYWVRVSNDFGTVDSPSATVEVDPVPKILEEPLDVHMPAGGAAFLSITTSNVELDHDVSNPVPNIVRWYRGIAGDTRTLVAEGIVTNLSGWLQLPTGLTPNIVSDSRTLVIPVNNLARGLYWAQVQTGYSNGYGRVNSRTIQVLADSPTQPAITVQPADTLVPAGQETASLSVGSSDASATYQWYKGISGNSSQPLLDETKATLTLHPSVDSGTYWVRVSNIGGSTDSRTATVGIEPDAVPVITVQPQDGHLGYPAYGMPVMANLSVTASYSNNGISSTSGLIYQWYKGTSGDTSSGLQSLPIFSEFHASLLHTESYWVRVIHGSAYVDSRTATIVVDPLPVPIITAQPQNVRGFVGTPVTLTVSANGKTGGYDGYLQYIWYRGESGDTRSPAAPAVAGYPDLTITVTKTENYWVLVRNTIGGVVYSNTVTVTADPADTHPLPEILTQPQDQLVHPGTPAFQLSVVTASPDASFQWYRGAVGETSSPVPGAMSPSVTITTSTSAVGSYWVRITNSNGSTDSRAAIITLDTSYTPVIVGQPQDYSVAYGLPGAVLTQFLRVEIAPPPGGLFAYSGYRFQWYKGTSGDTSAPVQPSGTSNIYYAAVTETTSFWVRASIGPLFADSRTATLSIGPTPSPTITAQPQNAHGIIGSQVTLSLAAVPNTTGMAFYRWFHGAAGDTSAPAGNESNDPNLTITVSKTEEYWVQVRNFYEGKTNSNTVTVTADPGPLPVILAQPAGSEGAFGSQAELTVAATNAASYQWYRGQSGDRSSPVAGATTTRLAFVRTDSATYWVRVSNQYGSANSAAAQVIVPPVQLIASKGTLESGTIGSGKLSLQATNTADSGCTFEWFKDGVSVATGTYFALTLSPVTAANAGLYFVRVTAAGVTVTTNEVPMDYLVQVNPTVSTQLGADVNLTVTGAGPGLTYQWYDRDGYPLPATPHYQGIQDRTLTIKQITASDAGRYRCAVSNGIDLQWSDFELLIPGKPSLTLQSNAPWQVSVPVDAAVVSPFSGSGLVITAKGLPPGVTCNTDGTLQGSPTAAGTFTVTLQGRNEFGASPAATVKVTVDPLPANHVGAFFGQFENSEALNGGLGGRFMLNVTANGGFTGSATRGATVHSFTGTLRHYNDGYSIASFLLNTPRGTPSLTLEFSIDPSGDINGALLSESASTLLRATHQVWSKSNPAIAFAGTYLAALPLDPALDGNLRYPQGTGYFDTIITATGSITAVARFADNTVATASTFLTPNASAPLHWLLYSGTGSVQGWIATDGQSLNGDLRWTKQTQPNKSTTRSYKAGFPTHALSVVGGRRTAYPRGYIAMGLANELNNAQYTLGFYGQTGNITQAFRITAGNAPQMLPGSALTLAFTRDLTKFTGTVKLPHTSGPCYGAFIDERGCAMGHIQMPESTAANAAILSRKITLKPSGS